MQKEGSVPARAFHLKEEEDGGVDAEEEEEEKSEVPPLRRVSSKPPRPSLLLLVLLVLAVVVVLLFSIFSISSLLVVVAATSKASLSVARLGLPGPLICCLGSITCGDRLEDCGGGGCLCPNTPAKTAPTVAMARRPRIMELMGRLCIC
jgi:hypothetical protein